MPERFFSLFFAACLGLVFLHCAGQQPPPGGPVDTTSPAIIRTLPDTNATNIRPESIELEFSEYVDRRSVEESIFLSPYAGKPEFDWSGTTLNIRFPEKLKDNRTYVLTVGTDVVDVRARNRMGTGYTLAFSTGDSIDRGSIQGRVYDRKPEGIMIFAYVLDGLNPDTLNPAVSRPDYITQTGSNGGFVLSNVGMFSYRLFAVRDEFKNLLYDKQTDEYGVTSRDVILAGESPHATGATFRMAREDTAKPFLSTVQAVDRYGVLVKFSEPIDAVALPHALFSLRDTLTNTSIDISSVSPNLPALNTVVVTIVSPMDSNAMYRLSVNGVSDTAGNLIDSLNNVYAFRGTSRSDTSLPVVSLGSIGDSIRGVEPNGSIPLRFSRPVQQSPIQSAISVVDAAKRSVHVDMKWQGALNASIQFREELPSKSWFTLTMIMDSVKDMTGRSRRDSIRSWRFETIDVRTTGTIEGTVFDEVKDSGAVYVTAMSIDRAGGKQTSLRLGGPGRFALEGLGEGGYVLRAFRDSDGSGLYSPGKPFPFVPAERFVEGDDTLKVRARWGLEGVLLKLK